MFVKGRKITVREEMLPHDYAFDPREDEAIIKHRLLTRSSEKTLLYLEEECLEVQKSLAEEPRIIMEEPKNSTDDASYVSEAMAVDYSDCRSMRNLDQVSLAYTKECVISFPLLVHKMEAVKNSYEGNF